MELEDPINLFELMGKPIMFKVNANSSLDLGEEDLLDESNDTGEMEKQTSPWQHSFDELKPTMVQIPIPNADFIYKHIIKDGTGDVMGRRKTRVQWSYSMFEEKQENSFDSSYLGGNNIRTNTFDEILTGLWFALETMRKGEEAHFIIDYKWMFGERGVCAPTADSLYKIKPESDILLVAKLVDFNEIGSSNACDQLNDDELRQFSVVKVKATEMYHQVKDLHRRHLFAQAIGVGLRTLDHLRFCDIQDTVDLDESRQLFADIYIVLIDCFVKTEKFKRAYGMINDLQEMMDVEKNVKILVNKAIVLRHLDGDDNFTRAVEVLRKAQALEPNNKLVNNTLNDIQKARQKYIDETKNFMRRAFQTKPQTKKTPHSIEDANKSKLAEIIKSFDDIDLGTGIPLVGYTPDELKQVEDALKTATGYKLQVTTNNNGHLEYVIKKQT